MFTICLVNGEIAREVWKQWCNWDRELVNLKVKVTEITVTLVFIFYSDFKLQYNASSTRTPLQLLYSACCPVNWIFDDSIWIRSLSSTTRWSHHQCQDSQSYDILAPTTSCTWSQSSMATNLPSNTHYKMLQPRTNNLPSARTIHAFNIYFSPCFSSHDNISMPSASFDALNLFFPLGCSLHGNISTPDASSLCHR